MMTERSEQEHKYTSTGIKFWRHVEQMNQFANSKPNTVITTHVSPEGACNLKCPYCSVTHRNCADRIDMDTIMKYITDLQKHGLKAVILTGGGEPTAYKHFNTLVQWIKGRGLSVALITNGTLSSRVNFDTWQCFSWVRVSINVFDDWQSRIRIPWEQLARDCVIGASHVYTYAHEIEVTDHEDILRKVCAVADNINAKYIRILPNCLLPQKQLIIMHDQLDAMLKRIDDTRLFHQHKLHAAPQQGTCHQSYFRPYLSEVNGGTVFPCDSVVLNDELGYFDMKFAICKAGDVVKYLNREIHHKFNAKNCTGCVFTENINQLDDYKRLQGGQFAKHQHPLMHEEFV